MKRGCFERGEEGHGKAECPKLRSGHGGRSTAKPNPTQRHFATKNFSTFAIAGAKSKRSDGGRTTDAAGKPNGSATKGAEKQPAVCYWCHQSSHFQAKCKAVQQLGDSEEDQFTSFDNGEDLARLSKMVAVNGKR